MSNRFGMVWVANPGLSGLLLLFAVGAMPTPPVTGLRIAASPKETFAAHIDRQLRSRMDTNSYTYDWSGFVPGPSGWVWQSNSWFMHQYTTQQWGHAQWPTNVTRNSEWVFRDVTNMTGIAIGRCGNYEMTPGCWPWMFPFKLVTPRHVYGCGHCGITLNELVTFYTHDSQMRQARLIAISNLYTIDKSEVTIGVLDRDLPGIEPLLFLPSDFQKYLGPITARLSYLTINQDRFSSVYTFDGTPYHASTRFSYLRSGDSGAPSLYIVNNQFVMYAGELNWLPKITATIAGLNARTGLTNQIQTIDLREFQRSSP